MKGTERIGINNEVPMGSVEAFKNKIVPSNEQP